MQSYNLSGTRNAFLKRWVFNFLLKVSIEINSLINLGTAFHNLGAANRKAHSPRVALGLNIRITK